MKGGTLPITLTWSNSLHSTNPEITNAATILMVLPILLEFLYFQRWIIRGFTMSGLKGELKLLYS